MIRAEHSMGGRHEDCLHGLLYRAENDVSNAEGYAKEYLRNSAEFKEHRKIGDKYAKFRSFAIEAAPQ